MKGNARVTIQQSQRLALNPALHASIRILQLDAVGLTRQLEELAAENPHVRLAPPPERAPGEWLPRWQVAFGGGSVEDVASSGPSLLAHVFEKAGRYLRTARERQIALALTEALEPSGWLGRPLPGIAIETRTTLAEVAEILTRLQRIDPPGLFARDLAECLTIQARDAGVLDRVLEVMLNDLPLVAAGDFAGLARRARTTEAEIAARLRLIRGFDPKPGARFAPMSASDQREPDLIVRREAGGWQVALNRSALPSVAVAGEGPEAIAARSMLGAVERRNAALLVVGRAILDRQIAALEAGRHLLGPMTMAEIATQTGLHESTVSRLVAGTSVDTPRGTLWLRALFSPPVAGSSAAALRERLAQAVAAERREAPLSDQALAAMLAPGGDLARRTVAKYRAELGIPPAARRRRRAFRDRAEPAAD